MNWKSIVLHVALVLIAWLVGTSVFGTLVAIIPTPLAAGSALFQKVINAYEIFGFWLVYRVGARLFRFSGPTGAMFIIIRLTWCLLTYFIVGGTAEAMIGHPTLVAGLSGIPVAVLVFFLPRPQKTVSAEHA